MRWLRKLSIRKKLVLMVMLTSTVTLLLVCGGLIASEWSRFRYVMAHEQLMLGRLIGANAAAAVLFRDPAQAERVLGVLREVPSVAAACVYTTQGEIMGLYLRRGAQVWSPPPVRSEGTVFEREYLGTYVPIVRDGGWVGTVFLQSDWHDMRQRLQRFTGIVLAGLALSLVVVWTLSVLLPRVALKPILNLARTVVEITRKRDYSLRAERDFPDEIGILAGAVNDMLGEIQVREEAVRAGEEHFRALIENGGDIIMVADARGFVRYASPSLERRLGCAVREVVGRPIFELVHREDVARFQKQFFEVLERPEESATTEYRLRRNDGAWVALEAVMRNLLRNKAVNGIVLNSRDITERRRAEEFRLAKDAAEASNRAKSEFLANMSHEIRTPMNAVLGFLDLTLETKLEPQQRQYLEVVRARGADLLVLINDILDLSKIEAGQMELERVRFSLRKTVDEVMTAIRLRALEKGLVLKQRTADDVPDDLWGDDLRLKQVLLNLLGNALKFTARGEIGVEVDVKTRFSREAAGQGAAEGAEPPPAGEKVVLQFKVHDTGIGIPRDKLQVIFEPFTQAESSHTRQFGGTGLGLTICRRLVERMGGYVAVESEPGRGSVFHFTAEFRAAEPDPAEPATADRAADDATQAVNRPLEILLAEDDHANQLLATALLQQLGHKVHIVENGRLAVEAAETARFDLIFMDWQMPEMSGLDAAREIRAREARAAGANGQPQRVPIVAMTAQTMRGDAQACLAAGMDAYLAKPIRRVELVEAMATALRKRAAEAQPLAGVEAGGGRSA